MDFTDWDNAERHGGGPPKPKGLSFVPGRDDVVDDRGKAGGGGDFGHAGRGADHGSHSRRKDSRSRSRGRRRDYGNESERLRPVGDDGRGGHDACSSNADCYDEGPSKRRRSRSRGRNGGRSRSCDADRTRGGGGREAAEVKRKAGKGQTEEDTTFDWYCSSCGNRNFARRSECFKCNTPRPSSRSASRGRDRAQDASG